MKYELTDERHQDDRPDLDLRRIRARVDVRPGVRAGDLGGWVESTNNLSQEGEAWVFGDARVSGDAQVWSRQTCLTVAGLPSGNATLTPTRDGSHLLRVGCWSGTVSDLRTLIATDDGWPEATGDEVARRRPGLTGLADLCDTVIASWDDPATWPAPTVRPDSEGGA